MNTAVTIITGHTHPGILLKEEFLEPLGIKQIDAARSLGIPPSRLNDILAGRRAITADTALRLGKFFGHDPRNWTNLQSNYDLSLARAEITRARPRHKIGSYKKVARYPELVTA
ncbi:MAG: HigA family addiction module antidote protein [Opitutaceae bacterium]|jgi:addiction module HigA family antidote|nr:HigA family addiction module antidote protein [Opitutaceae bacterium]